MNYKIVDRQELLNHIDGSIPGTSKSANTFELRTIILNLKLSEICLVWREEHSEQRTIWFVPDNMLQETVAFASTYIKNPKPFTGFTRILPSSAVDYEWFEYGFAGKNEKPTHLLALVIAEAFLQVPKEVSTLEDITIQASLGTISSTILNAIDVGYTKDEIEKIIANWKRARALLGQESTPYSVEITWEVWCNILAIESKRSYSNRKLRSGFGSSLPLHVEEAILEVKKEGEISYESWLSFCSSDTELAMEYENLSGVREAGVRSLHKITSILHASAKVKFSREERAVIMGAALSTISSGSLVFLPFSRALVELSPAAPLWYAYFCSLFRRNDILYIGNGLGVHLDKSIFKSSDLFDYPDSDISYEELMMASLSEGAVKFRTENTSTIQVELFPFVRSKFRINRQTKSTSPASLINSEVLNMLEVILNKGLDVIRSSKQAPPQKELFNSERTNAVQSKTRSRKKQNEKF